jgi:hypothetical protein
LLAQRVHLSDPHRNLHAPLVDPPPALNYAARVLKNAVEISAKSM